MTHECPGPGCTEQVPPDQLMCPACWPQVPKPLRRAVYIAWNRGAGAGTPAHQAAMHAAIAAVNRSYPSSPVRSVTFHGSAADRPRLPSSNLTRGLHQ